MMKAPDGDSISFQLMRIGIGTAIFYKGCEITLTQSSIRFEYLSIPNHTSYCHEDYSININDVNSMFMFNSDNVDIPTGTTEDISNLIAIRASPNSSNRLSSMEDHYINDTTFANMANEEGRQAPRAYLTFEFITDEDYDSFISQAKRIYKDDDVLFCSISRSRLSVYAKAMIEDGDLNKNTRLRELMSARSPKDLPILTYPFVLKEEEELLVTKECTEINFIFRPTVGSQLLSNPNKQCLFSQPINLYEDDRKRLITIVRGQYLYLNDALINFFILW
jgi:hypothetical protein